MENETFPGNVIFEDRKNISALDNSSSELEATFVYDQQGALWYVITVILVYSLSMFFLIATVVKRGSRNEVTDRDVDKYLKGLDVARQTARRETVLRVRLQWPGNLITVRHGTRYGMTVSEPTIEGSKDERSSESSRETPIRELRDTTADVEGGFAEDEPVGEGLVPEEDTSYILLNDIQQTHRGEPPPDPTTKQMACVHKPSLTRERRHGVVERSLLDYRSLLDASQYAAYTADTDESARSIGSHGQSTVTWSSCLTTDGSLLSDDISLSDIEATEISYDTENEA